MAGDLQVRRLVRIEAVRPYIVDNLRFAFDPRRIAVVGASRYPNKAGYEVVKALRDRGYRGEILPVNPHAEEILGLRAYKNVGSIAGEIDLAFVALPAERTKQVVEDCAAKGVRAVAVASSGFKEKGESGLEAAVVRCCRDRHVALLGPNLLAIGNPHANFSCGVAPYAPTPGSLAVISQSGANLLAILGASLTGGFGLSFFAGLGNKADVDYSELMEYGRKDPHTRCLALYIEGLDSEEAFLESCRKVSRHKPVVVLKAGTSAIGRAAAMAHTASNPGARDSVYDSLFRRAGAIRIRTLQDLIDSSLALTLMPPLQGENVVVVTNGGGSGLLLADEFERGGMALRELERISRPLWTRLGNRTPRPSSCLNPIDIGGGASPEQYRDVVSQIMADPNVDGVVVSICPTLITKVPEIAAGLVELVDSGAGREKPLVAEIQGGADCDAAILHLRRCGIPAYPTPERAAAACRALRQYTLGQEDNALETVGAQG
jgi:acyl-CoA synthetase (NDP forming)